eukprot:5311514-Amphidinium_carterae.1
MVALTPLGVFNSRTTWSKQSRNGQCELLARSSDGSVHALSALVLLLVSIVVVVVVVLGCHAGGLVVCAAVDPEDML